MIFVNLLTVIKPSFDYSDITKRGTLGREFLFSLWPDCLLCFQSAQRYSWVEGQGAVAFIAVVAVAADASPEAASAVWPSKAAVAIPLAVPSVAFGIASSQISMLSLAISSNLL